MSDALSSVGPRVSLDKIVYLSERMFYQEGTSDAAYLDQCARLRGQLGGMTQVGFEQALANLPPSWFGSVGGSSCSRDGLYRGRTVGITV